MADGSISYKIVVDNSGAIQGLKQVESAARGADSQISGGSGSWAKFGAAAGVASALVQTAMSAITSSIGSVISRVDTLNNFPRVMQSLGYTADEASAALAKVDEGIQGLPTTLDSAVAGTQRLAASVGDLDKASDIYLAMNNMILAGGANTQVASSAMEQFTQMISANRVDMQAWRSVVTACPAQLKQLSESILGAGASSDDLYKSLQAGTVSFEELEDAMISLNSNGTGEVTSMSEQAQKAMGGIGTAITNCKTAITKNVAKIIDAINGDGGTITGFFNGLKDTINTIGKIAQVVIPALINALIALSPVIVGITAAVIAYNVAVKAMLIIESVTKAIGAAIALWELYREGATLASIAQMLFNSTLLACPVTWIVLAITAIIAAIVWLWNTNEDFRNGVLFIWDAICTGVQVFVDEIAKFFTETLPNAINELADWFATLPERIWNALVSAVDAVMNWGAEMVAGAINAAAEFGRWFVDGLSSLPSKMLEIGSNIVHGLWNGITGLKDWVFSKIASFGQGIIDGIKGVFGIASPSRVFRDQIGKMLPEGLAIGVEAGLPDVKKAMGKLTSEVGTLGISGVGSSVTNNSTVLNINGMSFGGGVASAAENLATAVKFDLRMAGV